MKFKFLSILLVFITVRLFAQNYAVDVSLGSEAAQMVAAQMGIYNNPKTTKYINDIGERLIAGLDHKAFPYHFYVVDSWEPNAFALPGGFIFFTRGILAIANTEDELAGVMGHEIIHSYNRHGVQQMKKSILPSILQIPGNVVGNVINEDLGRIINSPLKAGGNLFLASYGRRHESEADDLGVELSSFAGYDPAQLAVILENLQKQVQLLTGEEEKKSYFSTHPITSKRVNAITKKTSGLSWDKRPQLAPDKASFLSYVDGMYFKGNPEQGVFQESKFVHPDMGLTVTFPDDWEKVNTPVAVGAIHKNGKGMVYMGAADTALAPEVLGKSFVKKLKEKHKIEPEEARTLDLNGLPAYLVTVLDSSEAELTYIHNLWFQLDDLTLQAVGVGYASQVDTLDMIGRSIRKLTSEEKNTVVSEVVRIVKANDGETLNELSKRTGNVEDEEMIAIINGLNCDAKLQKDQLIKIVKKEKYIPKK